MYGGTGIYSLNEASRLTRVPGRSIGRWLFGYSYKKAVDGERRTYSSTPLWRSELHEEVPGQRVIGFRDLLEIRVVAEFVAHGVPLLVVRRCLETASEVFGTDYPFTTHRFATDGKTVFGQVLREGLEREMVDLRNRQLVFSHIIKPSLYGGIEYEGDVARRWYPRGAKRRDIVLDPHQQFGKPMLTDTGVPTEAVYAGYVAEGETETAIERTAAMFELSRRQVISAVRFEESLASAA